jgi:pyruvate-formate lyase-activating enzyme
MQDGKFKRACEATLKKDKSGIWHRVITSAHLSRPEHYFSIYMSGCNFNCLKCHSHEFTKNFNGDWLSTDEIADMCVKYEETVTVWEPVERALDWYASELCKCCGSCILENDHSEICPGVLTPEQVLKSPQGFGPARNIVGYTGGDLACCAEFYAQLTEKIKAKTKNIHVLFETNGYGLTPENLELFKENGVDSFWLDIKAYDNKIHKKLCGVDNSRVLELPQESLDLNYQLEVLSLFIPDLVEKDQLSKIAELLVGVNAEIPFTLLAFFPENKLKDYRPPTVMEMIQSYLAVKDIGLKNVRIGNISVFARTRGELALLEAIIGKENF